MKRVVAALVIMGALLAPAAAQARPPAQAGCQCQKFAKHMDGSKKLRIMWAQFEKRGRYNLRPSAKPVITVQSDGSQISGEFTTVAGLRCRRCVDALRLLCQRRDDDLLEGRAQRAGRLPGRGLHGALRMRRLHSGEIGILAFLGILLALNIATTIARGFDLLPWVLWAGVCLVMAYQWSRARDGER
jgi:hypothetical protein